MKPTKEWLKELPAPYDQLALSVVDETWEYYKEETDSLLEAVNCMCDWLETPQGWNFWNEVFSWAHDNSNPLPPMPETLFDGAIELPSEPINQDWEAMYWEMAKARTSAVKEVQKLKSKLAKINTNLAKQKN
jgi:hypothetical protein